MFRGSFEHTLDAKGRLSLPSKFRDVLAGKGDGRVMITNFMTRGARCLDVYPLDEWQRLEETVRSRPRFDPEVTSFENYYLGRAHECTVDSQWRILIPPALRKYANLQRDVVLVSAVEKFRVWNQETWNQVFADAEEKFTQNPESFGNLGF
jgi:MraZ protein